jgi:hypothetical protein
MLAVKAGIQTDIRTRRSRDSARGGYTLDLGLQAATAAAAAAAAHKLRPEGWRVGAYATSLRCVDDPALVNPASIHHVAAERRCNFSAG